MTDQPLDYSTASGSIGNEDAEYDSNAPIENDGRSQTETGFDANDADHSILMGYGDYLVRHTYDDLLEYNEGRGGDEYHQHTRKANQRRDAITFCNNLGLTDYQTQRVVYNIQRLDINSFGQTNAEEVIMALISLVHRADITDIDTLPIDQQNTFIAMLDDLHTTKTKIRDLRTELRTEI